MKTFSFLSALRRGGRALPGQVLGILLVVASFTSQAQAPTWGRASSVAPVGHQDHVLARCTSTDAAGNVYIAGELRGEAAFGATTLRASEAGEVFVAKQAPGGTWLWAVKASGSGRAGANSLAIDASGQVVLAGSFEQQATFGSSSLSTDDNSDFFVAALDAGVGNWRWAVQGGGAGREAVQALALDAAGNIFVTGWFTSSAISLGATTLANFTTTQDSTDLFVARLNTLGAWQWGVQAGGPGVEEGYSIAVDAGGLLVGGRFSSPTLNLGSTLYSNGGSDVLVGRLSSAGAWQWGAAAGGPADDAALALLPMPGGEVMVAGRFGGARATFGAAGSVAGQGGWDAFVGRLGSTGTWLGVRSAGGPGDKEATSLLPAGGAVLVGGSFDSPSLQLDALTIPGRPTNGFQYKHGFVARLAPGSWEWGLGLGGPITHHLTSLTQDAAGHVYAVGTFSNGTMSFGATPLSSSHIYSQTTYVALLNTETALAAKAGRSQPALALWPNPAREVVQVQLPEASVASTLRLTNALGQVVHQQEVPARATRLVVALPRLAPGVYQLGVGQATQRLTVAD